MAEITAGASVKQATSNAAIPNHTMPYHTMLVLVYFAIVYLRRTLLFGKSYYRISDAVFKKIGFYSRTIIFRGREAGS